MHVDSTRSLFKDCHLRCTAQREAIYSALRSSRSHPTADELLNLVRPTTPNVSLATIYNTLEALCEAGLARKLPMTDGCCRYDGDVSDHIHVRLNDTNEIVDVPHDLGKALLAGVPHAVLQRIEQDLGIRIDGLTVQISGARHSSFPGD